MAGEYAELVAGALSQLTPGTYDATVELARSAAAIRGYDDIKSASIERWRADAAGLRTTVAGRG